MTQDYDRADVDTLPPSACMKGDWRRMGRKESACKKVASHPPSPTYMDCQKQRVSGSPENIPFLLLLPLLLHRETKRGDFLETGQVDIMTCMSLLVMVRQRVTKDYAIGR